jgi:hypothetical protein
MKIFIGQAITGNDEESIRKETIEIKNLLVKNNHDFYSTFEIENPIFKNKGDWVKHAFNVLENFNVFLAIVRGENKSEGLLMEIGYILGKGKKFILAIQKDVKKTYLRDMADEIIEWVDFEDLKIKLGKLK